MFNVRRFFSFPPNISDDLKSNFIHFYWDIFWWGLYTGTTASFLSIYAARCGATPGQIGLLTAVPAMVSLLLSLPVGRILRRIAPRKAVIFSAFTSRIFFVVYVLLPWLLPGDQQVGAILVLAVIISIPTTIIGISFSQYLMESIPSEWRGTVVGNRMAIMAIVSFSVTVISGQLLTRLPFPHGYQVVFFIGFFGAIITVYHLSRMRIVVDPNVQPLPLPVPGQGRKHGLLPIVGVQERRYLRVIGLLFLFNTVNTMAGPLVPDLLVFKLNLSDATISIGTAVSSILVFIFSLLVPWLTRRTGNRQAVALGAALLAFQAVTLALARDTSLYMVSMVIAGTSSGILNAAQYNYSLDNIPQAEQSTWLSLGFLLGNAAALLGSLGGPALAHAGSTPSALIIIGVLRLLAGLAILKWGS
jgi:MFS family permease